MEDLLLWIIVACLILLAAIVILRVVKKINTTAPVVVPPAPTKKPAERVEPPIPEPSLQTTLYALPPQSAVVCCPGCDGENSFGASKCRICGEPIG